MKRFPLPDLLKGFAAIFMVQIHLTELFLNSAGRESLYGKISMFLGGPLAAMIFMIVMGYFIGKSKKTSGEITLRGIKLFAVGLLLNIGLNFHLLLKIKYAGWQFNPLEYILGVDILYLAGLSIIFISVLKKIKTGQGWIALLVAFLILGLSSNMNEISMVTERNYMLPFIAGNYSWSYFPLFPWLAYPLIGFAFFHFEEKITLFYLNQKLVSVTTLAAILALIISFNKWGINTTIDLPAYYHHTFWYSLWAIGIVVLWVALLHFLINKFPNTFIGNLLKWLGKNITLFYVIQWLIIGNISTAIYQTQGLNTYWYWFVGIFTITIAITWLLEKTNIRLAR